ncbi:hypothetical protein EPR50_G00119140 [Perca flavescens]|uniref:Uncharacterized protein n=1 Tax=Perca flavescens TaxID=8167 RepID=A0A484CVJ7_PERFV|nr:hypothetical protein EPR50_G00119140 [Perca flavescens]
MLLFRDGEAESESWLVHTLAISAARPAKHLSLSPSFQCSAFASWTKKNICKKECCFFVKGVREDVCTCGYSKTDHVDEAIKPEDFTGEGVGQTQTCQRSAHRCFWRHQLWWFGTKDRQVCASVHRHQPRTPVQLID